MANSYNELFGLGSHSEDASLEGWWPLLDNAASTTVVDQSSNGNNGTMQGGSNTEDFAGTGPNSWLTSSLNVLTANVTAPSTFDTVSGFTVVQRVKPGSGTSVDWSGLWTSSPYYTTARQWLLRNANAQFFLRNSADTSSPSCTAGASMSTGSWYDICGIADGSNIRSAVNGSFGSDVSLSGNYLPSTTDPWVIASSGAHNQSPLLSSWSEIALFSRSLSSAEVTEWRNGPEPINSVAPALSGTETQGETLSTTTGTWGIDSPFSSGSNGTVTYAYQWTRSNDAAGSGEADISGATSNTYTLQAADVGKYIRCRVAASNDGGNDSGADTNSDMSGAIASSGGGATGPWIKVEHKGDFTHRLGAV